MAIAERILVADDSPTNAVLLEKSLCKAGYEVLVARDGDEAVEVAQRELPSLILLDMIMPRRDGIEVCQCLKSNAETSAIPVIFITSNTDRSKTATAFAVGGADYITKPFQIEELLARVSVHLELRKRDLDLTEKNRLLEHAARQLAQVNEELAHLARYDALSDLLNRRAWEESAALEHERSLRHDREYGIIMIDVDQFKSFNDALGHDAGDHCLRKVAEGIKSTCRSIDIVGRYGGEEFIVLAPESDAKQTYILAERIRTAIWDLALPHPCSPTASCVTASFGTASNRDESLEADIKNADRALYLAKGLGRNRTCSPADVAIEDNDRTTQLDVTSPLIHLLNSPSGRSSALIVDDDVSIRRLCRQFLEHQGFQVFEAENGCDALSVLQDESPDVIILDLQMKQMDGFECARRIKRNPRTQDIPIIVVSARNDQKDMLAALEAGAEGYLTKPIRPEELSIRIQPMVRMRRKQKELLHSHHTRVEQARALTILFDLCRALGAASNLKELVDRAVASTAQLTKSRRVSIMLPDDSGQFLSIVASLGIAPDVSSSTKIPVGESIAGGVFQSRQPAVANSKEESQDHSSYDSPFFASTPMLSTPLGAGQSVVGVLSVTERTTGLPFEDRDLEYIKLVANVTGAAIHGMLAGEQRELAYDAIMIALAKLAEHGDMELGRHLERVTQLAVVLAGELRRNEHFCNEMDDVFVENLRRATPLHDIGKVAVPDYVLRKPGRLSADERGVMKTHAQAGADAIQSAIQQAPASAFLKMAHDVARSHHEWYDGSGYPLGIAGDEIPIAARIVSVADVYDALTNRRPYKDAFSHDKSIAIIVESSGTQFDPRVVDALLECEQQFAELAMKLADVCDDGRKSPTAHSSDPNEPFQTAQNEPAG
jgi:diguanylate cyclase (GGDEF)-like protein